VRKFRAGSVPAGHVRAERRRTYIRVASPDDFFIANNPLCHYVLCSLPRRMFQVRVTRGDGRLEEPAIPV
jgi:hypothetical protein